MSVRVGGCDPDLHGAVVVGSFDGLRLWVEGIVRVNLPTGGASVEGRRVARLRMFLEELQVLGIDGVAIAVEGALRGAPQGVIRGAIYGMLAAAGGMLTTAPVAGQDPWWSRLVAEGGRVALPGLPPGVRGAVEAEETCRAWVLGPDGLPFKPGLSSEAQAACMARWMGARALQGACGASRRRRRL